MVGLKKKKRKTHKWKKRKIRRKIRKWKKKRKRWMWMSMKNGMAQSRCFLIRGADPLNPPPPASDSESEIEFEEAEVEAEAEAKATPIPPPPVPVDHEPEAEAATVGTRRLAPLTRLFANTQVWTGSSSSSVAVGHNPEDLTPIHIRSDLDALHLMVRQIKNDDVRAENNRLRMMLDC
ncbi:hypothetical protein Tco_0253947, partial [Tanacetum coccineum]